MDSLTRAEQRVKEMNLLTQQYLEQGNRYIRNRCQQAARPRFEPVPPCKPEPVPVPPPPPPREQITPPQKSGGISDFLGIRGLDDEKLLIIAIAFILIKEKADTKLLIALLYLIM